jgi:hypothetical protein
MARFSFRPTDLRFTRTNRDALKYSPAMQQRSGSCRVQPLVRRPVTSDRWPSGGYLRVKVRTIPEVRNRLTK